MTDTQIEQPAEQITEHVQCSQCNGRGFGPPSPDLKAENEALKALNAELTTSAENILKVVRAMTGGDVADPFKKLSRTMVLDDAVKWLASAVEDVAIAKAKEMVA